MMDNDDGGVLSRYSDSLCHLDFEKDETDLITVTSTDGTFLPPQSFTYLVVGKGESEFGPFLLQGLYNSWTRELDVTRKYITSYDPRSTMTIPQIRESLSNAPLLFPTFSQQNILTATTSVPTNQSVSSSTSPSANAKLDGSRYS